MRPGAPLSPGLKSAAGEVSGARLPAFAGPHIPRRPGAPLSPGLTEKTRHKPPWFTRDCELPADIFGRSTSPGSPARPALRGRPGSRRAAGRRARPGGSAPAERGVSLGAMRLADAPSEGPVEDPRDLRRAGDGPHLAVGHLGYLPQ